MLIFGYRVKIKTRCKNNTGRLPLRGILPVMNTNLAVGVCMSADPKRPEI